MSRLQLQHLMVDDTLAVDVNGRLQTNALGSGGEDFSQNPANGVAPGTTFAGGSEVVRGALFSATPTLPVLIGNSLIETASVLCYGPKKVVWVIVTTLVTFPASQATIQFWASRQNIAAVAAAGAAPPSQITAPNFKQSLGAAQNLGPANSLPVGQYRFGPEVAAIVGLNSPDLYIGAEIIFPGGNITAGVFSVEVEHGEAA